MKTETVSEARGDFSAFLSAWLAAGKPEYLPGGRDGFYLISFPVACSNTVNITRESLPAEIAAKLPAKDGNGVYCAPMVSPFWTRAHGVVLDVSYSCYCGGGWGNVGTATYLPESGKWVRPTEVHTYGYGD